MRNPLTDPQHGDVVVSKKGKKREVAYVTITGIVVYDAIGKKTTVDNTCDLKTWKRWAKDGLVSKQGPDEPRHAGVHLLYPDFSMRGQITGIANGVMNRDKRSAEDKINATPTNETTLAIFEIGLAHYWSHDYSARRTVHDRIVDLCDQKKAVKS